MRYLIAAVLIAACSDSKSQAEIAALKEQLQKVQAAHKDQTSAHADTVTPVHESTSPVSTATDDGPPEMTGKWLSLLLGQAKQNRGITYAHLKKNADRYEGKAWSLSGVILEISEGTRSGVTYSAGRIGYGDDNVLMFLAPFPTDFVQGDYVDMAGYLKGNQSYQSQAGWNITIPFIGARSILKHGSFAKLQKAKQRITASEEQE